MRERRVWMLAERHRTKDNSHPPKTTEEKSRLAFEGIGHCAWHYGNAVFIQGGIGYQICGTEWVCRTLRRNLAQPEIRVGRASRRRPQPLWRREEAVVVGNVVVRKVRAGKGTCPFADVRVAQIRDARIWLGVPAEKPFVNPALRIW